MFKIISQLQQTDEKEQGEDDKDDDDGEEELHFLYIEPKLT